MPDQCEMIIGFLVPHRCENPGLARCTNCGRAFCDEHVTLTPQGLRCLACQQGLPQPISLPITAQTYNAADLAAFAAASEWSEGDEGPEGLDETFGDLS